MEREGREMEVRVRTKGCLRGARKRGKGHEGQRIASVDIVRERLVREEIVRAGLVRVGCLASRC